MLGAELLVRHGIRMMLMSFNYFEKQMVVIVAVVILIELPCLAFNRDELDRW